VTPVLLDTGVIVALLDRREDYHHAATEAIQQFTSPLITCEPVIAESCHLLRRLDGAREAVLANVEAGVFSDSGSLATVHFGGAAHHDQISRSARRPGRRFPHSFSQ